MCWSLAMSITGSLLVLGACQRSGQPADAPAALSHNPARARRLCRRAFQCGDLVVTATFDGVGAVDLSWTGGPLTLPKVESASGARYADSQGNEFWSKGDEASVTLAGQHKRNCVRRCHLVNSALTSRSFASTCRPGLASTLGHRAVVLRAGLITAR